MSIILPIYNVELYLKECLDSLINQTLKDIEIICIDDKSTDNSLSILKEYANYDNRIIILEQEINQGPGVARNRGIDIAKGDYIMFCDPNDWYELDACEICYDKISKGDNDIAFFSLNRYLDDTGEFKYRIVTTNDFISKTPNSFWCGKNVFINFKIINKNNIEFPNYIIHEDHDFGLTLLMHTNNICRAETRLYYYRLRTGSIMNRGGKNTINNVPKILKKYLPIFKDDINQILNFYNAISCFIPHFY
ncbi:glycosyltransferase [Campylobacter devanensis]|uniref:glycosyltransferase n=1 Tax=Campylobacter devanensis TaxID=3161138 RepID=UPI000A343F81